MVNDVHVGTTGVQKYLGGSDVGALSLATSLALNVGV